MAHTSGQDDIPPSFHASQLIMPSASSSSSSSPFKPSASLTNISKAARAENNKTRLLNVPPTTAMNVRSKRRKRLEVLEEEDYLGGMEAIIQRDFFPDLNKLRALESYLSACRSHNPAAVESAMGVLVNQVPRLSNSTLLGLGSSAAELLDRILDTHGDDDSDESDRIGGKSKATKAVGPYAGRVVGLSLDDYVNLYTSEDNHSFSLILDKDSVKRRELFWWAYDEKRASALRGPQIGDMKRHNRLQDDVLKRDGRAQRQLETWPSRPMNSLMWAPELSTSLQISNVPPERVIKRLKNQQAKEEQRLMLADAANGRDRRTGLGGSHKRVVHSATRVPLGGRDRDELKDTMSVSAFSVKTKSSVGAAIGGYKFVSESVKDHAAHSNISHNSISRAVDVTETPEGMLMQWGQVRSEPTRLDGGYHSIKNEDEDVKPVKFTIAKSTRRQVVARELAEGAARKQRAKRQHARRSSRKPKHSSRLSKNKSADVVLSAPALELARSRLMRQAKARPDAGSSW